MPRRLLAWAPLGVAAAVLIWHSLQYNFVTDDAYISFVYSRNLAEHGELTFNLGDPVEGYTSFLWTFVLGVLMLVGIPPELSSLVLGTACGIGTLVVTYRILARLEVTAPWRYLPAFLLAFSAGFACWSSGGLETQAFTLLATLSLDAYLTPGGLRRMGVFLALAAMTRPEGVLVAAVFGVHRLALNIALERRWAPSRDELGAIASFAALWLPWFAWRWWYYGYFFPNTYYVKASGRWVSPKLADDMLAGGLYYVKAWLFQSRLVWALPVAALGVVWGRPRRPDATPSPRFVAGTACGALALVYLAYTVSVGGDFMGLHRFIMPVFVLAAIAVALGLDRLAGWIVPRLPAALRRRDLAAHLVAAALVAGFAVTQIQLTARSLRWGNFAPDHGIDTPAFLIAYTEDRATIGRHTRSCFRPGDFSIVGGAGAQPYYARMRGIDVFGLVSDRVAHNEPRIRARAGHTKFASDATLDTYDPTFVFSCYALHPAPEPPRLPCDEGRWLRKGYEKVTLEIPGLREKGTYYTFFARKERAFTCPGRVR